MGNFLLVFSVIIAVIGIAIFAYEVKSAKEIDAKEPFFHDDYDPNKDPTIK